MRNRAAGQRATRAGVARCASALVLLALVAACAGGDDTGSSGTAATSVAATIADGSDDTSPTTPSATATTVVASTLPPASTAPPTTAAPLPPVTELRLVPIGAEEMVFDWSESRCDDLNLPDIATRVVRNAAGTVQLYIGNLDSYRMVGPELDAVELDCSAPAMSSDFDPDPAQFNDQEWLSTTYTTDGETVWGIVHNEYTGAGHPNERPGQCPSGVWFDCLDVSLTLAVSTDGGATFVHAAEPPNHLIATLPYQFDDEGMGTGLWQTSNLVDRGDGFLYMLVNISTYPDTAIDGGVNWICALRTDDISDPTSWRYWDGQAFAGVFANPYTTEIAEREICAPVDFPALSGEMSESIIWVESIGRYVIAGGTYEPGTDQRNWGTYYSTSEDLIDWSPRRLIQLAPVPPTVQAQETMSFVAYPTLIDPDSTSRNFDTSDGSMYLYQTRFNEGSLSLDRDLVRYPVAFEEFTLEPPVWEFDEAGDFGGWVPELDVVDAVVADGVLSMRSTGDDPILAVGGLRIPAQYDRIEVTMSGDAGRLDAMQMFFLPEGATGYSGATVAETEFDSNGELQTLVLDMSGIPAWAGMITALRFDPVTSADTAIVIDRIAVTN